MKQQSEEKIHIGPVGHTLAGILFAATLIALTLLSTTMLDPRTVSAQEPKTADVIVQFDGSDTAIRSIQFTEAISGITALELSGFEIVKDGSGSLICSVEGVGCPADDCFCGCPIDASAPCYFWGYSSWDGNAWQPYSGGFGSSVISQTGSIEGLRWGKAGPGFSAPLLTGPPMNAQAAQGALNWLRGIQVEIDGGFGALNSSMEAAMAIGANREKASDWSVTEDSSTLDGYLLSNGAVYAAENAAASGKVAVSAASTEVCQPAGYAAPATYYDESSSAYSKHNGFNAWAMLGALSAGDDVPTAAVQTLIDVQQPNGGWEWMETFGTDTNTTSLAIQALIGAGQSISSTEVISGLDFLKSAQNDDGGFTYDPSSAFNTDSDGNSTAYSIQAIQAAGQNPMGPDWTSADNKTPVDFLLSLQLSDGSFEYLPGTGSNPLATQQAVPALLGNPYPNGSGINDCDAFYLPSVMAQ